MNLREELYLGDSDECKDWMDGIKGEDESRCMQYMVLEVWGVYSGGRWVFDG